VRGERRGRGEAARGQEEKEEEEEEDGGSPRKLGSTRFPLRK